MEWLAFSWGLKPSLRLWLPPEVAAAKRAEAEREGWACEEVADGGYVILYVARSAADAAALRDAEGPLLAEGTDRVTKRAAHVALARRLGYPRCCAEAYVERLADGVLAEAHEDYVLGRAALEASGALHARLNYFRRGDYRYLVPFYPCRFDCPWALRYASGTYEAIERRGRPGDAARLREALEERIVVARDGSVSADDGAELPEGALRLAFDVF